MTDIGRLPHPRWRWALLLLMAAIYLVFGVVHIVRPDPFLPIMPEWVPEPRLVVVLTGVCEVAGAFGLLMPQTRWWAGIMLAVYAVCVYPANVKHAFMQVHVPQLPLSWWYHGPRLLFQPVFVWWALYGAGVIDWPFATRRESKRQIASGA